MTRRWITAAPLVLLLSPLPARADGAMPDEVNLFFPAGKPDERVLTTTFGLLVSQNGGATFEYSCEEDYNANGTTANLYQVAADGTILADTGFGLYRSIDGACTWSQALANVSVLDAAFDPTKPGFLFALTNPGFDQGAVVASSDDGACFGPLRWQGNATLTGVEFSRSRPGRVYVAGNAACPGVELGPPFLLRSDDRGQTWTTLDLSSLGAVIVRIARVDPTDPDTVWFRVLLLNGLSDWLAVTHDGGKTVTPVLSLGGTMSAFLLAADGTVFTATRGDATHPAALWRLGPGSAAFQKLEGGPHLRCLRENGSALWGCGDHLADGMAIGRSADHGETFCTSFTFQQMNGMIPDCPSVQSACGGLWGSLSQMFKVTGPADAGYECLTEHDAGFAPVNAGPMGAGDAGACVLAGGPPAGPEPNPCPAAGDGGSAEVADGGTTDAGAPGGGGLDAGRTFSDGGAGAGGSAPAAAGACPSSGTCAHPTGGCGCGAAGGADLLLVLLASAFLRRARHSYRSASIGSSREAFRAG